ncbi:flagellin/flagellar hook associated protein, partial [Chthonomonas calidirosea]
MLQLNTNVTALGALYNLNQVSDAVASSIQKLSSGLRINSAADDPAGLIISEKPARASHRPQSGYRQWTRRHQPHQNRRRRPLRGQQPPQQHPTTRCACR